MKKLLLIAAMAVATFTASAQVESSLRNRVGIALEAGIPTGNAGDMTDLAIGGSLFVEHPVNTTFSVTGSAGFTTLTYKSEYKDFLKAFNAKSSNPGYIPLKVGARYYFVKNFFAQGELGAAIATTDGSSTAFAWAPGVGLSYPVSGRTDFEAGVRYESWAANGGSLDQIAFRAALKF